MGDFSVGCGVSNLSLIGCDAVLIPLTVSRWPGGNTSKNGEIYLTGSTIVTNSGAMSLFDPFTLPIFGYLGDYGSFESIEEDFNTRAIERWSGVKIAEFCEAVCYRPFPEDFPIKHTAGMWVHREIYDLMCGPGLDEWGKPEAYGYPPTTMEAKIEGSIAAYKKWKADKAYWEKELNKPYVLNLSFLGMSDGRYLSPATDWERLPEWVKLYEPEILSGEITPTLAAFWRFLWAMMSVNRILMPTFSGNQYGNSYQHRLLARKTVQILSARIKERR